MDIIDHQLLRNCEKLKIPVIVSTGAATIQEVYDAAAIIPSESLCLMQCVSNYPASLEAQNLSVISTYKNIAAKVGYSDHTKTNLSAQIAIALGASVIEKHITLDKTSDGPDHSTSLTPEEFKEFTQSIRQVQNMMGNPLKKVQSEEENMRKVSRKSLYWSRDIEAGRFIGIDDFIQSRPGDGIYSSQIPDLIGKKARTDLKAGSLVNILDIYE